LAAAALTISLSNNFFRYPWSGSAQVNQTVSGAGLSLQSGYMQTLTVSENRQGFSNIQAACMQAQGEFRNFYVRALKQKSFIGDNNDI
jgi:hypothetical protein